MRAANLGSLNRRQFLNRFGAAGLSIGLPAGVLLPRSSLGYFTAIPEGSKRFKYKNSRELNIALNVDGAMLKQLVPEPLKTIPAESYVGIVTTELNQVAPEKKRYMETWLYIPVWYTTGGNNQRGYFLPRIWVDDEDVRQSSIAQLGARMVAGASTLEVSGDSVTSTVRAPDGSVLISASVSINPHEDPYGWHSNLQLYERLSRPAGNEQKPKDQLLLQVVSRTINVSRLGREKTLKVTASKKEPILRTLKLNAKNVEDVRYEEFDHKVAPPSLELDLLKG